MREMTLINFGNDYYVNIEVDFDMNFVLMVGS